MAMRNSIIDYTDSYKVGHWDMLLPDTEKVYSYMESRRGAAHSFTQWFGLQGILQEYLAGKVVTLEDIHTAKTLMEGHFGDPNVFNEEGWTYIADEHAGRLPLEIRAVPEGTCVPTGNALMTVVNTDTKVPWLTNYVESLLTHVWYPTTVATISRSVRKTIERYLDETGCAAEAADFMLHDFGYRGATTNEAASIGGAAHLTNFLGTDTIVAMTYLRDYYFHTGPAAFSVRATEHSIMTSTGNDLEMFDFLLDRYTQDLPEEGLRILSIVADSYDIYKFVEHVNSKADYIKSLKNFKLVVRPDSITPQDPSPESLTLNIMSRLAEGYGTTKTAKGFALLDEHIGVLWGDGIGPDGIRKILELLKWAGFAAANMVFGMGGGLLQRDINRDTERFAFKCSAQLRSGVWVDIQKNPLDPSKKSKTGRFALVEGEDGVLVTVPGPDERDIMETVFLDGEVTKVYTLEEVRARATATAKAFA